MDTSINGNGLRSYGKIILMAIPVTTCKSDQNKDTNAIIDPFHLEC